MLKLSQEIPPHNYICGLVAEHNTTAFNSRYGRMDKKNF